MKNVDGVCMQKKEQTKNQGVNIIAPGTADFQYHTQKRRVNFGQLQIWMTRAAAISARKARGSVIMKIGICGYNGRNRVLLCRMPKKSKRKQNDSCA